MTRWFGETVASGGNSSCFTNPAKKSSSSVYQAGQGKGSLTQYVGHLVACPSVERRGSLWWGRYGHKVNGVGASPPLQFQCKHRWGEGEEEPRISIRT